MRNLQAKKARKTEHPEGVSVGLTGAFCGRPTAPHVNCLLRVAFLRFFVRDFQDFAKYYVKQGGFPVFKILLVRIFPNHAAGLCIARFREVSKF